MTTTAPALLMRSPALKSVDAPVAPDLEAGHRFKSVSVTTAFKAVGEDAGDGTKLADGEFIALAAVFGNVDSYGERIVKGAFADTLSEWAASGDPIPVIWQHNWSDPAAHIGVVLEIRETDEGLLYKGRLDIDDNPFAAQVYRLLKGRRVTQQSFGFDTIDGRSVTEDGRDVFELLKVHLYEVGPCLVGVNQATNLLDIKSGSVAAPAPAGSSTEPSGQASDAAGDTSGASSAAPGSDPTPTDPSPASKGLSPASTLLILDSLTLED